METLCSFFEKEALRELVEGAGLLGPVIFVLAQALQVVLAPVPGEVTGFVAGLLFGAWKGFFLAMVGLGVGSSAAFFLARTARPYFVRRFGRKDFYLKAEAFVKRRGTYAAFLLFLFPGFPKDYLCYALGLLPFRFRDFLVVMMLGRAPATLALTLEGDAFYREDWRLLLMVAVAAVVSVLAFWCLKRTYLDPENF